MNFTNKFPFPFLPIQQKPESNFADFANCGGSWLVLQSDFLNAMSITSSVCVNQVLWVDWGRQGENYKFEYVVEK